MAAGVVGFSVYSANGDNGFFNPSEAEKPIEVLPDAAQRAWSIDLPYNEPRLVPLPVNGTSTRGVPSAEMIIVGDFVIGRLTENVYEEGQETIIEAFAVADGSRTPLATMIDPVCATNSSGLEGEEATASSSAETTAPSPDLLVCAGGLEDRPQILVLDPAAGGAVGGWDVPRDVAMIGSSPQGVVTIDKPKDGETTVRWYEPDGTAVWTQDLASLGADIDTFINDEDKFGYRVNLSPVGDGFVFSSVEAVVAVNRAGVSYAAPCWSLVVTGDVYACVDFESGELVARAIDGTQRWSGPEVTIVQGVYQRAPILVSEEYVYDDKYTVESMDYAVIDAVTGVQGPTLVEILDRGRADLMGTPEHPMLIEIERQDDYDDPTTITVHALAPDGSQVLWSTEIQGLQYARSVLVGERVLIEVEYGSWTVIDVATGEITGGVEIVGAPATEVDGDVIASNYGGIERIALP